MKQQAQEIKKEQFLLQKHINGIFILVIILISIYVLWFFAKPALQTTLESNSKTSDLEKRKEAITKTVLNLKAKDYQAEENRLSAINNYFPTENDAVQMLSYIEFEAKNNNLKIGSLKTGSNQIDIKSQSYEIQGSFEGSYENILNFFSRLKNSERAIGIKSAVFNPQDEGGKSIGLSLIFNLPQVLIQSESTIDKAVTTFTTNEETIIATLGSRQPILKSTASATFGKPNPFSEIISQTPKPTNP
jgi:Tfp pilus assembly protein PilO